jgi:hypothetical protein
MAFLIYELKLLVLGPGGMVILDNNSKLPIFGKCDAGVGMRRIVSAVPFKNGPRHANTNGRHCQS